MSNSEDSTFLIELNDIITVALENQDKYKSNNDCLPQVVTQRSQLELIESVNEMVKDVEEYRKKLAALPAQTELEKPVCKQRETIAQEVVSKIPPKELITNKPCVLEFIQTDADHKSLIIKLNEKADAKAATFRCSVCNLNFQHRKQLDMHINRKHTLLETKFTCTVCDKECEDSFNLWEHMPVHTGQKRFRCNNCGAPFLHLSQLGRHGTLCNKKST